MTGCGMGEFMGLRALPQYLSEFATPLWTFPVPPLFGIRTKSVEQPLPSEQILAASAPMQAI